MVRARPICWRPSRCWRRAAACAARPSRTLPGRAAAAPGPLQWRPKPRTGPSRSAPAGAARAKATVPPRAGWFWSTGMSRRVPAPWASSCGCCGSRRPWTGSLPARPPTGAASWTGWWRPSIPSTPPACWFSKRSCASATFCWRIRARMEPGLRSLEAHMAEAAVAIAAARLTALEALQLPHR